MLTDIMFPGMGMIAITDIEVMGEKLIIHIAARTNSAVCPSCQAVSSRAHSHYHRFPHDLPCVGQKVRLKIRVRRFFGDNSDCRKRTFAEQFPFLLAARARRTGRLTSRLKRVAYEVSAESGRRLLAWLDIDCTADRLLRLLRGEDEPVVTTPRVLGVDDWAKRKGQTYGTILVDLESHETIDLLPERSAEALSNWLVKHPGVEIISRDRGNDYIKGATSGAPNAIQVADRWHLLANLRDAVERMLMTKPACLRAAAQKAAEENRMPVVEPMPLSTPDGETPEEGGSESNLGPIPTSRADALTMARRARKQERFDLARTLHAEGLSDREIGRQMKMNTQTVRKYIAAESCPFYPTNTRRGSRIDPYRDYLQERWDGGCHNASQLWREVRDQGFKAKRGVVAKWAAQERKRLPKREKSDPAETVPPPPPRKVRPWSPRRTAWLLVKGEAEMDKAEKEALERVKQADNMVANVHRLVQAFQEMVRQRQSEKLCCWLNEVIMTGVEALVSFAKGIEQDFAAVFNALHLPWSSGQTEGQINRLKFVKRQMFGRANFDLLRRRVLGCPLP